MSVREPTLGGAARNLGFGFLVSAFLPAQDVLWVDTEPQSVTSYRWSVDAFGDFNLDGYGDLAMGIQPDTSQQGIGELRILSGVDGSTIWPSPGSPSISNLYFYAAGDVDGDGRPDAAMIIGGPTSFSRNLQVLSLATNQILYTVGPFSTAFLSSLFSNRIAGHMDVDGDGRSEIVALSSATMESNVYVINSNGTIRYTIPALALGWIAESVAAMPDLDGDGGDDFVVGAHMPGVMGGVFAVSGRTGRLLHFSAGIRPGDVLSGAVCDAGDVDGDGVHDYAAATYLFVPTNRIALFSGATGALIRDYAYRSGVDSMVGNLDADLDGVPDLIVGNGGFQLAPGVSGQLRCYSGRDGSILWNYNSTSTSSSDTVNVRNLSNLGPQSGSPYPVVAWLHQDYRGVGRAVGLRANLLGAGPVRDAAFSSTGTPPLVGMRTIPNGVQIHASNAPPGALAWLLLGGGSQTSFGGVTVPMQLDPFGLPGLTVLVPPFLTTTSVAGTQGFDAGFASVALPVAGLDPLGIPFAAQWLFLDPPTGGFAITDRHDFRFR
ncbi:MAG: FG-GAP-like repeat-containing protein [Planctomycetota bacterium]